MYGHLLLRLQMRQARTDDAKPCRVLYATIPCMCQPAVLGLRLSVMLAVGAAKGGADSVRPLLQDLYRTRASAYQQAVRSFVEGYREGLAEQPRDGLLGTAPQVAGRAGDSKRPQTKASDIRGGATSRESAK